MLILVPLGVAGHELSAPLAPTGAPLDPTRAPLDPTRAPWAPLASPGRVLELSRTRPGLL